MSIYDFPVCQECGSPFYMTNVWCDVHEKQKEKHSLGMYKHDIRPEWDEVWMTFADTIARRSKCTRAKVGSVIVSEKQSVLSASYNGPPAAFPADGPCTEWCPRARGEGGLGSTYDNCPAAHSEINGIARADHSQIAGATAYVTYPPCYQCAKAMAAAGVIRVVYRPSPENPHLNPEQVEQFLKDCGIQVDRYVDATSR